MALLIPKTHIQSCIEALIKWNVPLHVLYSAFSSFLLSFSSLPLTCEACWSINRATLRDLLCVINTGWPIDPHHQPVGAQGWLICSPAEAPCQALEICFVNQTSDDGRDLSFNELWITHTVFFLCLCWKNKKKHVALGTLRGKALAHCCRGLEVLRSAVWPDESFLLLFWEICEWSFMSCWFWLCQAFCVFYPAHIYVGLQLPKKYERSTMVGFEMWSQNRGADDEEKAYLWLLDWSYQ